ncbi:hypothetical protein ACFFRR_005774 [Megaselia abdita]
MDSTLENIILKRLCSALTDIVTDVLKYCKLDPGARDNIIKTISNIDKIINVSPVVDSDPVEKTFERPLSTVPRKSKRIAAAGKRRLADISKVHSSQKNQKRGKIDQINLQLPTNSSNDDDIIIVPDDVCDKEEPNLEVNVQQNPSSTDLEEELVAPLPSKSIFISGLPKAATIKAISNHISKKLPLLDTKDMEIVKYTVKGDYASFILKTDRNKTIYDSLIETSVWPENTIKITKVTNEDNISIYYQNTGGLKSKLKDFYLSSFSSHIGLILL